LLWYGHAPGCGAVLTSCRHLALAYPRLTAAYTSTNSASIIDSAMSAAFSATVHRRHRPRWLGQWRLHKGRIAAGRVRAGSAAYMSAVEFWRELPDGEIEFTMKRLNCRLTSGC
jgi:hypothetical protein